MLRQQKRVSGKPRTWRYEWVGDDRLVGVTTPERQRWRYRYDALGRRVAKQRLGEDGEAVVEQLDFTWDGLVLAEQVHAGDEAVSERTTTWEWEPSTFRPVSQTERVPLRDAPQREIGQAFYAIVSDLIGTPTELVDANGHLAWHPRTNLWGASEPNAANTADCPLRFPGQYFDPETVLSYNVLRYYDPEGVRYASNDPLGLAGGIDPHGYVLNPTGWSDPLGLMGCSAPNTPAALPAGPRPIAEIGPAGNPGAFRPSATPNFSDPAQSPGVGWQWRGTDSPGSRQGSWHNPRTGESLHPDLSHGGPIGAHYDYRAPNGVDYRVYPDGRMVPK